MLTAWEMRCLIPAPAFSTSLNDSDFALCMKSRTQHPIGKQNSRCQASLSTRGRVLHILECHLLALFLGNWCIKVAVLLLEELLYYLLHGSFHSQFCVCMLVYPGLQGNEGPSLLPLHPGPEPAETFNQLLDLQSIRAGIQTSTIHISASLFFPGSGSSHPLPFLLPLKVSWERSSSASTEAFKHWTHK